MKEAKNGLDRNAKATLGAGQFRKSELRIKAPRSVVLGIDNDSECRNVRARGAFNSIGDKGRAEVTALIGCRDSQSPQEDRGNEWVAGKAPRLGLRQVCEKNAGRRNRVIARNDCGCLLDQDEARGDAPPDVLGRLLLKVAVERLYPAGE